MTPLDDQLAALYPFWRDTPASLRATSLANARLIHLPDGARVFDEGQTVQGFPCVLAGCVRVLKASANGRELPLYRIAPGESCLISCQSLVGKTRYAARAISEGATQILLLPPPQFDQLLDFPVFRDFVLSNFVERLAHVMTLVEEVAFHRLDERLAALLIHYPPGLIHRSHQQLADELGSVRVIVSRLLSGFADQGLVRLGRESIEVLDATGLRKITERVG